MIDYLWIKILCPAWSFLINCGYWIRHINDLKQTRKKKKEYQASVKDLADVRKNMAEIHYKKDTLKDWRPWVITFIHAGLVDDCDGAAVYARFLFEQIGIRGKVISLRGQTGHAVYLSNGRHFMTDNEQVVHLDGPPWGDDKILAYFKGRYTRIIR